MGNVRLAVTVSDQDSEYIEGVVENGSYTTRSDYIRDLVRRDRERSVANLMHELQKGLDAPDMKKSPQAFLARLNTEIDEIEAKQS